MLTNVCNIKSKGDAVRDLLQDHFDVVVLSHVLEHLTDRQTFLNDPCTAYNVDTTPCARAPQKRNSALTGGLIQRMKPNTPLSLFKKR